MTTVDELREALERAADAMPGDAATTGVAVVLAAKAGAEAAAGPWREVERAARQLLTDIIIETGETRRRTPAGIAYIPTPSKRVTYDAKALDILCADDPDLARRLRPYRTEKATTTSLTIIAPRGADNV